MVYYLLRRLVGAVAVLFGVVTGTFVLSHVVPSCPACAVAGLRAGPEQVKAAAHSLGLDRPGHCRGAPGDAGARHLQLRPLCLARSWPWLGLGMAWQSA